MKTYLKNVANYAACAVLFLVVLALLELIEATIQAHTGISKTGIEVTTLVFAFIAGAVKTFRDCRQKCEENEIETALLDAIITEWRKRLADIDAEEPSAERESRRTVCKITLAALEEKRGQPKKARKRRGGHESHTCKH